MTQNEFLRQLKIYLAHISKEEQDRIIEYYSEIINDKIEAGKTEEQVIAELGSPESVAQSVLEDSAEPACPTPYPTTPTHKENTVGNIIGFTILIPLVLLMLIVLGSLIIALASIVIAFIFSGLGAVIASVGILAESIAVALFQCGLGLLFIALGIFILFGFVAAARGYGRMTVKIVKKYIRVYGGTNL